MVSETIRDSWHTVWEMGIIEFFNIWVYRKNKDEKQKRLMEQWKRQK